MNANELADRIFSDHNASIKKLTDERGHGHFDHKEYHYIAYDQESFVEEACDILVNKYNLDARLDYSTRYNPVYHIITYYMNDPDRGWC
jgi:hypothetical protein